MAKKAEKQIKIGSKSGLAIVLSSLEVFPSAKVSSEQYPTDSEIAAQVLFQAHLMGDISKGSAADLGCGTGILGIGCLLLGAKKVYFVECDASALDIAKNNLKGILGHKSEGFVGESVFLNQDIALFNEKVSLVIQNPPFGTKVRHADREFLKKAFEVGDVVYSFHKSSTRKFVEGFAGDYGFRITHAFPFLFPLKRTMDFHTRKIHRIEVSCFRFCRRENDK